MGFYIIFQNPLDKSETMCYNTTKQNDWRRNYGTYSNSTIYNDTNRNNNA